MLSRKLSHLVLILAVSAGLMAAGGLSTLFSDNFSSGTDANWTRVDILAPLGGTTYDASSGRYEFLSNASVPALPFQLAAGSIVSDSLGNPHYRRVRIRATLRFNNSNSNVVIGGRVDISQMGTGVITGYPFFCNNVTNEISIGRIDPNLTPPPGFPPITISTLVSAPFAFVENETYKLEAQLTGAKLTLKVWPAAGVEPHQAQLTVTDSLYRLQSGVFAGIYSAVGVGGVLSGSVDNVVVLTDDQH